MNTNKKNTKDSEEAEKLRPAIFMTGQYNYSRSNVVQEGLLLKAMSISDDPKMWRRMAGISTMSTLWRTLNKMSIRKEYHEELVKNGVDLGEIVRGITNIAKNGEKESNRLRAWQAILRSLGLDEYKVEEGAGQKGWEDALRDILEKGDEGSVKKLNSPVVYDVKEPEIPEEERIRMEEERKIGEGLYE